MRPILVTGVPRSGNTWLARLLAMSAGTALAGREPMNPRGRQYALGRTLDGWTRLAEPTARQRFLLRAAYRGWNPFVYSRFGMRQWAGPLPWTRLVVKDPYALLSMPAVVAATRATPVVVYRHPGAVLASYRRVGWTPRLDEVASIVASSRANREDVPLPDIPLSHEASPAEQIGAFWACLHELALDDAADCGAVIVSHSELAGGGEDAGRALADRLGLVWTPAMADELGREASTHGAPSAQLHNLQRAPAAVAEEWRSKLGAEETEIVEGVSAQTLARVEQARFRLS